MRRALLVILLFSAQGCIGAGVVKPSYVANPQLLPLEEITVFRDNSGPLSYHSPTLPDVGKTPPVERVQGRACQRGLSLPVLAAIEPRSVVSSVSAGWGHGAYREALDEARRGLPAEAVLYDVRVDLNLRMILTFYRELCLEVDAAVALPSRNPVASPDAPPPESAPQAAPTEPTPPSEVLTPAPVEAAPPATNGP